MSVESVEPSVRWERKSERVPEGTGEATSDLVLDEAVDGTPAMEAGADRPRFRNEEQESPPQAG
ncbi:MAG: hypothetical protein CBB69_012510 [Phycisphaera sp. TMED9]|nr:MAG: hypothetical protein CBB69_012510 [Phycisphaera sp. TMED9]